MKNCLKNIHARWIFLHFITIAAFILLAVAIVYASGGGEGGHEEKNWFNFAWRTLNFAILAGFLYWLVGNRIKEFFVGRRDDIKTSLAEAVVAKEEAEKKYKELADKMDKATGEITDISDMIKAQGLAEKEKIIEDAKKAAEQLKEDTQRRVEQEFNKASNQLRAEAVALSVQIAEDILKKNITVEDHESMVRDYLDKVVRKN